MKLTAAALVKLTAGRKHMECIENLATAVDAKVGLEKAAIHVGFCIPQAEMKALREEELEREEAR